MEDKNGYGTKKDCCEEHDGHSGEAQNGHKHTGMMKHGVGMMLCCLAPVALLAAIPLLGLRQRGASSFLVSLICPIGMVVMMFSMSRSNGKSGSCHGNREERQEEV